MTDVLLTVINPEDSSVVPVAGNAKGELKLEEPIAFDGNLNGDLVVTGNISLSGNITGSNGWANDSSGAFLITNNPGFKASLELKAVNGATADALSINTGGTTNPSIKFKYDGSVLLAHGKAGITKDGNLWVTTVRGEVVMLDSLMNGLGSWVEYDPTTLKDQVLDAWSEKDKPSETK